MCTFVLPGNRAPNSPFSSILVTSLRPDRLIARTTLQSAQQDARHCCVTHGPICACSHRDEEKFPMFKLKLAVIFISLLLVSLAFAADPNPAPAPTDPPAPPNLSISTRHFRMRRSTLAPTFTSTPVASGRLPILFPLIRSHGVQAAGCNIGTRPSFARPWKPHPPLAARLPRSRRSGITGKLAAMSMP